MQAILVADGVSAKFVRSARRKTIGIKVNRGAVEVRAPLKAPLAEVEAFVQQKASWIIRHLKKQQSMPECKPKTYELGQTILYLGKPYVLGASENSMPQAELVGDCFLLPAGVFNGMNEYKKLLIENWFLMQAEPLFSKLVREYGDKMGVRPTGIKIRLYQSRWGSCTQKGQLQFNWLLLMAPISIVEYVVVHELAHLKFFNHSSSFWQFVERTLPNFKFSREWLKNQKDLVW